MPYASQSAIELAAGGAARLVELGDFNSDGVLDADVLARAQAAADDFINAYLKVSYTPAVIAASQSAIRLAADEAVYQIRRWRGMLTQADETDRKSRERECDDLRKGIRRLDNPSPPPAKRAAFVENDDVSEAPVSRKGTKGMW